MITDLLDTSNFDFDSFKDMYGSSFTDDIIANSVENASEFFGIEDPALILTQPMSTGVLINNPNSVGDDVLNIDVQQLQDLGINTQDALDLVLTHETTHRILQGTEEIDLSATQEELCCDYMAGVRAGLNGIDISQFEQSLVESQGDIVHPKGTIRVEAINAGVEFAQSYLSTNDSAPSFQECLNNFEQTEWFDNRKDFNTEMDSYEDFQEGIVLNIKSMEDAYEMMRYYAYQHEAAKDHETEDKYMKKFMEAENTFYNAERNNKNFGGGESGEGSSSVGHSEIVSHDDNVYEPTFEGNKYTKEEINSHIRQAEARMRDAQSAMNHNAEMLKIKSNTTHSFEESQFKSAQRNYDDAKKDLNHWKYEKPKD